MKSFLLFLSLPAFLLFIFDLNEISAEFLGKSPSDLKSYQNKNYHFELKYPSNWTYVEFKDQFSDNDLKLIASFVSPVESSLDPFQEYFTVKTKVLDPKYTFSNYLNLYLESLKKSIQNLNLSKPQDISSLNKFVKYSFSPQPGLTIYKDEYIYINNYNIFHIEFTSNEDNDKNFKSLINQVASHFRIIKS